MPLGGRADDSFGTLAGLLDGIRAKGADRNAALKPAEAHLCCGSAGTYNLLQPQIATRLRARKLDNLRATAPDIIAAGNIGCLTQLAGGGMKLAHTVELLDWMAGGPAPEALRGLPVAA